MSLPLEAHVDHAPLPLGPSLDFLRLVWAVVHRMERVSKRMERRFGVTASQRFVIRLLGRFPGLTLAQVASLLEVHPSTASGILKRLERRGLVLRRVDTRDRRRAYLGLTAVGRRLDTTAEGTVEAAVDRMLAVLPTEHVASARDALNVLTAQLAAELAAPRAAETCRAR